MEAKYQIDYSYHDRGANNGSMIRKNLERAEWSANLLKECGYSVVIIKKI